MNHVRQESGSSIHTNSNASDNLKLELKGLRTTSTFPNQTAPISEPAFGDTVFNSVQKNVGYVDTNLESNVLSRLAKLEESIYQVRDIETTSHQYNFQSPYLQVDQDIADRKREYERYLYQRWILKIL